MRRDLLIDQLGLLLALGAMAVAVHAVGPGGAPWMAIAIALMLAGLAVYFRSRLPRLPRRRAVRNRQG
ncbi:MAG: hypothetical protein OJJ55_04590 [Rhodococcus sp.]|nr:hypothetical protein [Rhodococcus sp. (in: high G+C Gram-positive bacteria)]